MGVTDSILLEASKMNGTVIVPSVVQKTVYEERCKEYGVKCPELFTVNEVIGNIRKERSTSNRGLDLSNKLIFIDGLGELLKRLALSNVVTAGDSIDSNWISKQKQVEGWRAKMIRKLDTIQKQENLNTVFAVDEKGNGNANHEYLVFLDDGKRIRDGENVFDSSGNLILSKDGKPDLNALVFKNVELITFQNGARNLSNSTRGVLDTDLLEIVRDRLIGFQGGAFASKYNEEALYHVEKALEFMNERAMERVFRGVLGTNNK